MSTKSVCWALIFTYLLCYVWLQCSRNVIVRELISSPSLILSSFHLSFHKWVFEFHSCWYFQAGLVTDILRKPNDIPLLFTVLPLQLLWRSQYILYLDLHNQDNRRHILVLTEISESVPHGLRYYLNKAAYTFLIHLFHFLIYKFVFIDVSCFGFWLHTLNSIYSRQFFW